MYGRTFGISKEDAQELIGKLTEFGLDASDMTTYLSVHRMKEGKSDFSIEIPTDTILEVQYHTAGRSGKDRDEVGSVDLALGTRSTVSFDKDGGMSVKI